MEPNYPSEPPPQPLYPQYPQQPQPSPQQPPQQPLPQPPQAPPYAQPPQQPAFPPQQPYSQPPPQVPYAQPPQPAPYTQPPAQPPYQTPPQQQPYSQPPQMPPFGQPPYSAPPPQPFPQPPQAPYQTPAPSYPTGPFPGMPYQPPNPSGFPPGQYPPDVRMGGPPLAPASSGGQSQRGVIITAISILLVAVLAGAGFIAYSAFNHHSTSSSTASNSNTSTRGTTTNTTTTHPATATPAPIMFSAAQPSGACPDNGTNGNWQDAAAKGDTIQCQTGQVAIYSVTPSQSNIDDEIFFNGVQNQPFPVKYQVIVFVDIGQANNACAGILARAVGSGNNNFARFGFFVCGGASPTTGTQGFDEVIPYDAKGNPIQNQIVYQNLPEGTKARYSMTVHANGSTIAFDLDSHQVAAKSDIQPGSGDYVALAVDTGLDTGKGTDITLFSNFSFDSLS